MSKGVVLMSGGLDSTVTAYMAKKECDSLHGLFIEYGQRHIREWESAAKIAEDLDIPLKSISIPLFELVDTALTGQQEVKDGKLDGGIPNTWVPQRNSIFLALAFAYAETLGATDVYIGVNSVDYSGYPDCRPEFIGAIEAALNLASKRLVDEGIPVLIKVPLMVSSKKDIILKGFELQVPLGLTWSCYRGGGKACGRCDSCMIRLAAFEEVGLRDPIEYEDI